jgi:fatty acid-binding protein DegV
VSNELQPGTGGSSIGIVLDASCDVPRVERRGGTWVVLPEVWAVDDMAIVDDGEASANLLRTALTRADAEVEAVDVEDMRAAYAGLASCERVFSIHASRHLSPAVLAAAKAAEDFDNVFVVETDVSGIGVGLLAVRAGRLVDAGHPAAAIEAYLARNASRIHFLAVPDRVDPSSRRRFSAAGLLSGQPVMSARDGLLTSRGRVRTRRATIAAVERHFLEHTEGGGAIHLAVGHADAAGAVDPLVDLLERLRPGLQVDLVGRVGPRLVQRVGSRCVGLAWIVER